MNPGSPPLSRTFLALAPPVIAAVTPNPVLPPTGALPRSVVEPELRNPYEKGTQLWFRFNIIHETLETERCFTEDMSMFAELIETPLRAAGLLTPTDLHSLFSNLSIILRVHQELLKELTASEPYPFDQDGFARAFRKFVPYLQIHVTYCVNYHVALTFYNTLAATRPDFAQWMQEVFANPRFRFLSFSAFVVKPVSRICKYPLLIKELRKWGTLHESEHYELGLLEEDLRALCNQLNERMQQRHSLQRLEDLERTVEDCGTLVTPTRKLVLEFAIQVKRGSMDAAPTPGQVFLFSDIVMLAVRHTNTANGAIILRCISKTDVLCCTRQAPSVFACDNGVYFLAGAETKSFHHHLIEVQEDARLSRPQKLL